MQLHSSNERLFPPVRSNCEGRGTPATWFCSSEHLVRSFLAAGAARQWRVRRGLWVQTNISPERPREGSNSPECSNPSSTSPAGNEKSGQKLGRTRRVSSGVFFSLKIIKDTSPDGFPITIVTPSICGNRMRQTWWLFASNMVADCVKHGGYLRQTWWQIASARPVPEAMRPFMR